MIGTDGRPAFTAPAAARSAECTDTELSSRPLSCDFYGTVADNSGVDYPRSVTTDADGPDGAGGVNLDPVTNVYPRFEMVDGAVVDSGTKFYYYNDNVVSYVVKDDAGNQHECTFKVVVSCGLRWRRGNSFEEPETTSCSSPAAASTAAVAGAAPAPPPMTCLLQDLEPAPDGWVALCAADGTAAAPGRMPVRGPTTLPILQNDGPCHLGLRCNALHAHQMALITSGFVRPSDVRRDGRGRLQAGLRHPLAAPPAAGLRPTVPPRLRRPGRCPGEPRRVLRQDGGLRLRRHRRECLIVQRQTWTVIQHDGPNHLGLRLIR